MRNLFTKCSEKDNFLFKNVKKVVQNGYLDELTDTLGD